MLTIHSTIPDPEAPRPPTGTIRAVEESALEGPLLEAARLRGVTRAAADRMGCCCPEYCERDHANE